jgi:hypothetical protein
MTEVHLALTWLRARLLDTRHHGDGGRRGDAGASIVETVVIIGLFVAAAIVIVGILVTKATQAANSVQTQ